MLIGIVGGVVGAGLTVLGNILFHWFKERGQRNVHNKMRIKTKDEKGLENLSQYIIRNAFSLEKLKYYENSKSVMLYHSKMTPGKNKKDFQIFSPLKFIAAITQHISEQSFQLVR